MIRSAKLLPLLTAAAAVLIVLGLVALLDRHERSRFANEEVDDVAHQIGNLRMRIEQTIASRAALTRGLVAYVASNPRVDRDDFERFMKVLVDKDEGIRYVSLVQNGAVSLIYPYEGNEDSLGAKPGELEDQREALQRMFQTRRSVLAGPVKVLQGRTAFILRTPIRISGVRGSEVRPVPNSSKGDTDETRPEKKSSKPTKTKTAQKPERPEADAAGAEKSAPSSKEDSKDWAGVIIKPEVLLREAGVLDAPPGVRVALRGRDGRGAGGEMIHGNAGLFDPALQPVLTEVVVPGGFWQLAGVPTGGWGTLPPAAWRLRSGGLLLALLAGMLSYILASNPQRLRHAIEVSRRALLESELRYGSIFEHAQEGIYQTTPDGRYLSANPALARIHGYPTPEAMIEEVKPAGSRYEDPLRRDEFRRLVERDGAVTNFESQVKRRDGSLVWVRENARAVTGPDGKVAYYEGTLVDITSTKEAEAALHISQMELQIKADSLFIINSITNQLYRNLDLHGVIERAMAAFNSYSQADSIAMFSIDLQADELHLQSHRGLSDELIRACSVLPLQGSLTGVAVRRREIVAVDDVVMDERTVPQARGAMSSMNVKGVVIIPLVFQDQVQGVVNVAWHEPHHLTEHEIETLMSIGRTVGLALANARQVARVEDEVRERRRAEEALVRSEARYRLVSELTSDFAYALRIEGDNQVRREWVTGAFARITGYEAEEVDHLGWNNIIHPDDWSQVVDRMRELRKLKIDVREFRIRTKAGGTVWVRDIARPIRDEVRGVTRIYGAAHDITERKLAEGEKAELEAQLRHTQKMEALGTLAGGVAHDFNNLLTGILGYAGLLKMNQDPQSQTFKSADVIEKAAERASQLTRQMLGFARRGKLQDVAIDLHSVVQEVISLLSRSIGKNIMIHQKFRAKGRMIKGDPSQIQQVVLNLAVNARDAMPDGGELTFESEVVRISANELRRYNEAHPGDYFVLTVRDSGHGIPRELHERVFDPFFTTREQGKGTGMGLAMVYGIVRNHGGFILLDSEPGQGAKFSVFIPAAPGGELPEPEPEPIRPVHGEGTILVIDDEEVIRDLVGDMLKTLGYKVLTAVNGVEGVEFYKLNWRTIDLVILDMIMPQMGGKEAFESLRAINPNVRAILSTGYGKDGAAQEILDLGPIGFVQKPYRLVQISEIIAAALKTPNPPPSSSALIPPLPT